MAKKKKQSIKTIRRKIINKRTSAKNEQMATPTTNQINRIL